MPFENTSGDNIDSIYVPDSNLKIGHVPPSADYPHPLFYFFSGAPDSCSITGRSFESYRCNIHKFKEIDLIRLMQNNLDKKWMEVGSGLSEFMPLLAKKQKNYGGPKPTIIDPVDYATVLESVQKITNKYANSRFGVGGSPLLPAELIKRLEILANPEYVNHLCCKVEELSQEQLRAFKNSFFTIIDYCATELYVNKKKD